MQRTKERDEGVKGGKKRDKGEGAAGRETEGRRVNDTHSASVTQGW